MPDETVALYAAAIHPFDAEPAGEAVRRLIATGTSFRPSIGDVRRAVLLHIAGDFPSAEQAWVEVVEQLREPARSHDPMLGGRVGGGPPVYSHDLIRHAVETYPAPVALIDVAESGKDFMGQRHAFVSHYTRLVAEATSQGQLPAGVAPGNVNVPQVIESRLRQLEAGEPVSGSAEDPMARRLNCSAQLTGHTDECRRHGWTDLESGKRYPPGRCGTYQPVAAPPEWHAAHERITAAVEERAETLRSDPPAVVAVDDRSPAGPARNAGGAQGAPDPGEEPRSTGRARRREGPRKRKGGS
jgi:hypothetical protein